MHLSTSQTNLKDLRHEETDISIRRSLHYLRMDLSMTLGYLFFKEINLQQFKTYIGRFFF